MQLYSAKIRLGGSLHNEVVKTDLTAPEILMLKAIHNGPDGEGVVDIKPLGKEAFDHEFDEDDQDHRAPRKVLRTEKAERKRLEDFYPQGKKVMTAIFGVGNPLPQHIEGVGGAVTPEAPARRRKSEPAPAEELGGMA